MRKRHKVLAQVRFEKEFWIEADSYHEARKIAASRVRNVNGLYDAEVISVTVV